MQGIENGINGEVTLALLSSGKLDAKRAGLLSSLAGAIWTQDRLHRAKLKPNARCAYCNTREIEDHNHMWWTCPAWAGISRQYPLVARAIKADLPHCTRVCAIIPETADYNIVAPTAEVRDDVVEHNTEVVDFTGDNETQALTHSRENKYGELHVGGRGVVITDGALRENQFRQGRFAGTGAF